MKALKKMLDNIKKDNTFEKSLVSKKQHLIDNDEIELRMLFVMWKLWWKFIDLLTWNPLLFWIKKCICLSIVVRIE